MDVQKPTESHAEININKICNDSSTNTQAKLQAVLWMLFNSLTDAFVVINKAKNESGLAAIKAGFAAANETATAGLLQLGGGAALAGAGVIQGVAGCKSATEITEAVNLRDSKIAYIKNETTPQNLSENLVKNPDITIQVEALNESVSPELNEIEEEIFYDAEEEIQSCKQTEPENQAEETQKAEQVKARKTASKEEDKLLRQIEEDYKIDIDLSKAKASKLQGLAAPGQGLYYASQGLGELEKSKAQKENIQQQVAQDNQNQQGNTADDIKRKADKLTEFDAFRSNSSSLRG
ncbi:MAG: hypothetical protein ACRDDW_01770 [Candidatus Rhabdochlamydia sp.]